MAFCRTSFQINLFLPLEAHCCRLRIFCFTDSWKNITKFRVVVLGPRPITLVELRKKGNGLCFRRTLWKSSLYTFTSSLFLILRIYTELIIIIVFDRAENRSALVWETLVWSLTMKSRLFYAYNNFRKNYTADYSFIASFLWFFQNVWVVQRHINVQSTFDEPCDVDCAFCKHTNLDLS